MPGLLEYALRADAPQMGLLGRLGAFLNERQDFANNRMRQLRESEWRPWEWDYDTKAAEMRGLLAGQAGGGPEPDWTSAIGDALGSGVTPGLLGVIKPMPARLTSNILYDRTVDKMLPVSVQADVQRAAQDAGGLLPIRTFEQAELVNANPERIADWNQIYKDAPRFSSWSDAYKKPETGKLEDIQSVCLTKGCQRQLATRERIENQVLAPDTKLESCYGGECFANLTTYYRRQGKAEGIDVRGLQLADISSIPKWFESQAFRDKLNSTRFIRQGWAGDDSHLFATGIAKSWLEQVSKWGVKPQTVFISAGYAPTPIERYRELLPYKDKFVIHFSNSGWFDKNEIMLRLNEWNKAKSVGLNAKIRLITNKDKVSGIDMQNEQWLIDKLDELKVRKGDVLETPFHDDRTKVRSKATGKYKSICCETGKCGSCSAGCCTTGKKTFEDSGRRVHHEEVVAPDVTGLLSRSLK